MDLDFIAKSKFAAEDSRFPQYVFGQVAKYCRIKDSVQHVCAEEYIELSSEIDVSGIQESCSARNILRTRELANLIVDDEGVIHLSMISLALSHLKEHLHSLGPDRQHDTPRVLHICDVLHLLQSKKKLIQALKLISKPYSNKHAEQIIRDTLHLPENKPISDAHARRAALSAWICYLRQNVGSCFATAPAILVHKEQPEIFLKDINDLIGTGRLKRTFGGVEYSAPISSSWGAGDLRRTLFLSQEGVDAISQSPGLKAAIESVGIVQPNQSIEGAIVAVFENWEKKESYLAITIEELISRIIQQHLSISHQDIEEYEMRPRAMIHGKLMMHVPSTGVSTGGMGQKVNQYYSLKDQACRVFKSFADNALLKSWEFTLASFAETKPAFTKWNLYSSLGFQPNEKGGIGERLYEIIKQKLDETNQQVQDLQFEYEQAYNQLKYYETRIRRATEQEAKWINVEYQSKLNEFRSLEEFRDTMNYKAKRFANLMNELISQYDLLFPEYFQEVYDADMHDVNAGPYDDSPAGFRLVYKHGRANTSLWTKIYNENDYIDALYNFFVTTENTLTTMEEFKGLEEDLAQIITTVVDHVKTKEFLESSLIRMAKAHNTPIVKNPLENIDKVSKKPWMYTSGGTMSNLVACYYCREDKPTETSRWVENPTELMVFLIDSLKEIPYKVLEPYENNSKKALLMHSPTHAFLLHPGITPFNEAWQTDEYSYTWVRDHWINLRKNFVNHIVLDPEKMRFITEQLLKNLEKGYREYFLKLFTYPYGTMSPAEYRDLMVDTIERERGLSVAKQIFLNADSIDSYLYSNLPLFNQRHLKERVTEILKQLPEISNDEMHLSSEIINQIANKLETNILSSKNLIDITLSTVSIIKQQTSSKHPYHHLIIEIARKLEWCIPKPIFFADTNWIKDYFAFVVNPGTGELELWRVDYTGTVGEPMSVWKQWLNGSRKDIPWGIYTNPKEYTGVSGNINIRRFKPGFN